MMEHVKDVHEKNEIKGQEEKNLNQTSPAKESESGNRKVHS